MMLVGIMPVRSEQWVVEYAVRAALGWLDHLVVLNHASTDDTGLIIGEIGLETGRITVISEPDPEWREMHHRQRLLDAARQVGATHVAIIDADEVLTANLHGDVRRAAARLAPGEVLTTPWLNLWRSLDRYRSDRGSPHGRQWLSLVFCDRPALRWGGEERFHHRQPFNSVLTARVPAVRSDGGVMHLQRASWRRARARQAWYKGTERLRWPDKPIEKIDALYSRSLDEHGIELTDVPPTWWDHGIDRGLIDLDAEPWQEGDVRLMIAEHGAEAFEGLDLFGVAS